MSVVVISGMGAKFRDVSYTPRKRTLASISRSQ